MNVKSQIKYDNFYFHNRNFGCRYNEIIYKSYRALIIENEKLRITILVGKGTDIIELLYKPMDIDFMWRSPIELYDNNKNQPTKQLGAGSFLDTYEGGWQELLPNINDPTNYKDSGLGTHGEAALLPWDYEIVVDSVYEIKVKFSVRMNRAPFLVIKYLTIKSTSSVIEFEEKIKNEGDEEFKFMWSYHPAIGKPFLDDNCVIDLPDEAIGHTYHIDYSGNSILHLDKEFKWPFVRDKNNLEIDLSKIMSDKAKTAFNVYLDNLKEGWYRITNLKKGIGFGLKWDVAVFKYLMIWFVYRGYYGFPFYGRTYNVALEPWSAVPGNLDEVIRLKRELSLLPLAEIETKYSCIIYESRQRIKGFDENNKLYK